MSTRHTLTIVGCGSVGVATLGYLLANLKLDITKHAIIINIIDNHAFFGPGVIFSHPNPIFRINFDAPSMGILPLQPGDYQKWLTKNQDGLIKNFPKAHADTLYPARFLYGIYLKERFNQLVSAADKKGVKINLMPSTEVVDLKKNAAKFELVLQSSAKVLKLSSDAVFLATGQLSGPNAKFPHLVKIPQYYSDPYDPAIVTTSHDKRVLVIGNQSSACEVVANLLQQGFKNIMTVSRTGCRPHVMRDIHQEGNTTYQRDERFIRALYNSAEEITLERGLSWVEEQYKQLGKEIDLHDHTSILQHARSQSALKEFSKHVNGLQKRQLKPFEAIIATGLSHHMPKFYSRLSHSDKKRFLDNYQSLWMSNVTGITLENAKILLAGLRDKKLLMHSGFQAINYVDDKAEFHAILQQTNTTQTYIVDVVINATGRNYCLLDSTRPLDQSLIESGLMLPHPRGGIYLNKKTMVVFDKEKRPVEGLYAVNPTALKGEFFHTAHLGVMKSFCEIAVQHALNSSGLLKETKKTVTPRLQHRLFSSTRQCRKSQADSHLPLPAKL